MSKRRNTLSSKLSGNNKPSWQDTIVSQEPVEEIIEEEAPVAPRKTTTRTTRRKKPAKSSKYVRKTFLMTPDLIERLEETAEEERVGISELVRFLMINSLDMIENGELEIPTTEGKRTISI